jgi:hypothetical protein
MNCPFFCSSKRKGPKKRSPEKTTGSVFRHLHDATFRSKKQNPVRTFSGVSSARCHHKVCGLIESYFYPKLYCLDTQRLILIFLSRIYFEVLRRVAVHGECELWPEPWCDGLCSRRRRRAKLVSVATFLSFFLWSIKERTKRFFLLQKNRTKRKWLSQRIIKDNIF